MTAYLPKKGKVFNWFIVADVHDKEWTPHVIDIMTYIASQKAYTNRENKPGLIINGDLLDLVEFMKKDEFYKRWIKRQDGIEDFFIPAFDGAICWALQFLEIMKKHFSPIIYIRGNHEDRVDGFGGFLDSCPTQYHSNFSWNRLGHMVDESYSYNELLDLGSVLVTHGMFHSATAHKRHADISGKKSIIFSHIHSSEGKAFPQLGFTKYAFSTPCCCTTNPGYFRGRVTNHDEGFVILSVEHTGDFRYYPVIVRNKRTLFNGKIISASHQD